MTGTTIFKIRDSVDLFLGDESILTAYFINTRRKKTFRIDENCRHLLEAIDGETSCDELASNMLEQHNVGIQSTLNVLEQLFAMHITDEVADTTGILPDWAAVRYARQINYFSEFLENASAGFEAQLKVMDSHVLIFGCGAVGGDIAVELCMAGVGQITLYDYSFTDKSDASRHIYYRDEYEGIPKAHALAKELRKINSKIKVNVITERMEPDVDIEPLIRSADFIVNTLDEPYIGYTSAKISRVCVKLQRPHFIAGGFDAHLASTGELVIPYVTPCVECYADHFKEALSGWKPAPHPVAGRDMEIGGLASMTLFSASFACAEILKHLTGITDSASSYKARGELLFDDLSLSYLDVERRADCPVCGDNRT